MKWRTCNFETFSLPLRNENALEPRDSMSCGGCGIQYAFKTLSCSMSPPFHRYSSEHPQAAQMRRSGNITGTSDLRRFIEHEVRLLMARSCFLKNYPQAKRHSSKRSDKPEQRSSKVKSYNQRSSQYGVNPMWAAKAILYDQIYSYSKSLDSKNDGPIHCNFH